MPRRLRPILLPFMISPSTPYLRLLAEEDGATWCEFAAYFGPRFEPDDEGSGGEDEEVITVGSPFVLVVEAPGYMALPEESTGLEPYRWVRVTFDLVERATFEVIGDDSYDDDVIEGAEPLPEGGDIEAWLRKRRTAWRTSGLTDLGISEILDGVARGARPSSKVLFLAGHDAAVTVVCQGFRWQVMRDLPGW